MKYNENELECYNIKNHNNNNINQNILQHKKPLMYLITLLDPLSDEYNDIDFYDNYYNNDNLNSTITCDTGQAFKFLTG
jgi:hypothetical protein